MYTQNCGTNVLPLTMQGHPVGNQDGQDGLYASAVSDKPSGEIIVKVVNTSRSAQDVTLNLQGLKGDHQAQTLTLSHDGMDDENTLDNPTRITPRPGTCAVTAGKKAATIEDKVPPMSFRLYRIK